MWEAIDTVLGRAVALKVLAEPLASNPSFVERFRREARAAASLAHPNIVGVYDYGEEGDLFYIVMESINGETLAERLRREGQLEPEEAARIAAEVADALEAAHQAVIVHRDVKPSNVMLARGGEVQVSATWPAPATNTSRKSPVGRVAKVPHGEQLALINVEG